MDKAICVYECARARALMSINHLAIEIIIICWPFATRSQLLVRSLEYHLFRLIFCNIFIRSSANKHTHTATLNCDEFKGFRQEFNTLPLLLHEQILDMPMVTTRVARHFVHCCYSLRFQFAGCLRESSLMCLCMGL